MSAPSSRLSFMRFLGLGLANPVPDANARLRVVRIFEKARLEALLRAPASLPMTPGRSRTQASSKTMTAISPSKSHVVADRDLLEPAAGDDALVHAFEAGRGDF